MRPNSSASPNHDSNFAAAASAPEISTSPGGVRARMGTSGASVPASREKSRAASAAMNPVPGSVAEDGCMLTADPFPERCRPCDARVGHQAALVELAGVEADRADEQFPAAVRVLLEQAREGGTAVAGESGGVNGGAG